MKKLNRFLYFAIPAFMLAFVAGFFLEIKLVMVVLFSLLLLAGYVIYKEKIGQELIIAFLIALAWTSYYFYEYTSSNLAIGKINLFPLVCWTAGLVLLREIYEKLKGNHRFLKATLIYLLLLFIVEYIGYYPLKIQLNSNFTSLLGIGIIHASPSLKAFYLLAGPVYLLITDYLKVK